MPESSFQRDEREINNFAMMGGANRIGGMKMRCALGPSCRLPHQNIRFKQHQHMLMGQIAEYQDRRRKIKNAALAISIAGVGIALATCA